MDEIFEYIAQDNPDAALSVDEDIRKSVTALVDFPRQGRPGRRENTRELVVPGLPYVIIYAPLPDKIIILRVLHGARKWPN